MTTLLKKYKFTSKGERTKKYSTAQSPASYSQDSEVTCIPETPSSENSKVSGASPGLPEVHTSKADSSENSPTFSTNAKANSESNVRRHILGKKSSNDLADDDDDAKDNAVKDSDETYLSGYSSSIRTVESSLGKNDQECEIIDDEISVTCLESRTSGDDSSDSEIESAVARRRKKRALSPWNATKDDENSEEEDSDGDEEMEEKPLKRRRVDIRRSSSIEEETTGDSQMTQLTEMFPQHSQKDIKKALSQSDGSLDIAVSLLVDKQENSGSSHTNGGYHGGQLNGRSTNTTGSVDKKKPPRGRRICLLEDENEEDSADSDLPEPFAPPSPSKSPKRVDTAKTKPDVPSSRSKYNGGWLSKEKYKDHTDEKAVVCAKKTVEKKKRPRGRINRFLSSDDEEDCSFVVGDESTESDGDLPEPFTTESPSTSPNRVDTARAKRGAPSSLSKFAYNGGFVSNGSCKETKDKKRIVHDNTKSKKPVAKKNPPRGKRSRIMSSEEEEEDDGFVVHGGDGDDADVIDQSEEEEEEEEEEAEAISSDDEDEDDYNEGGEEFSTSFQTQVVDFFNTASIEELQALKGCSRLKALKISKIRPFDDFSEVVEKFEVTPSLTITMIENCEDIFSERQVLVDVLDDCCTTSQKIQKTLAEEQHFLTSDKKITLLNQSLSLKPYQVVGVNWMKLLHQHNINGILADEMGLGKTIQVVAFLASLLEEGKPGPHLIVAPASTLENWLREFNKWCPAIEAILYTGSQDYRLQLAEDILHGDLECNVLITSYTMATSELEYKRLFKKLKLHYSVYDEGHMLKNIRSLRYRNLMKIKSQQKMLLTGTPLQNNLLELMSLICFVVPSLDSTEKAFTLQKVFSNVSGGNESLFVKDRIQQAKRIMAPFVLRRVKDQVLADLPKKIIEVDVCPMVASQQVFYQELKAGLKNKDIEVRPGIVVAKNIMSALMELRKLSNHPLLMRREYTNQKIKEMSELMLREPTHEEANPLLIEEDMRVMSDFELHELCKLYASVSHFRLPESAIRESGKFKALDRILPKLKEQGEKVLLFSQFVMMLDIMEPYMKQCKHTYLRMDGSTSVGDRAKVMDKFTNDPDIFVFLLSTKACGLGINLTIANTVILYDIDYNPHNDKQAEDRCHRLGQTKDVRVIKLVSKDTIDETMLQRAQQKLLLEKQMISDENDDEATAKVNIAALLKDALEFS